jgi:hypothetical protein
MGLIIIIIIFFRVAVHYLHTDHLTHSYSLLRIAIHLVLLIMVMLPRVVIVVYFFCLLFG